MCVIVYTAKDRGHLRAGTNAGDVVILEIPLGLEKWTPFQTRKSKESRSLSGSTFTTLHRTDYSAYATTHWVDDEALQDQIFYEFASSVAAGETFTIDPYGTFDAPDEDVTVKLQKGNSVAASRYQHWPRFKYSFTVDII
jgi:hypothetical protein